MSSTSPTLSTQASDLLIDGNKTISSGIKRLREFTDYVRNNPEGGDPDKDPEYQRLYQQVQECIDSMNNFSSKGEDFLLGK